MSIHWSSRPSRGEGEGNYRLVRVQRAGVVRGIILSRNLEGTGVHYWKGKSMPCAGSACEPCREGFKPRWYGYVAIWNPRTDQIAIAEVTDSASDDFDRFIARHNTLRGGRLTLSRQGQRPNGRILAQIEPGDLSDERLPDCPNVQQMLMKIWGVNQNHAVSANKNHGRAKNSGNPSREQPADAD